MKVFSFLLVTAIFLTACNKAEQHFKPVQPINRSSKGIVLVYDLTLSDTFLKPDRETVNKMLYSYCFDGVQMTGIHVLSDSRKQQPWLSQLVIADTTTLPLNAIRAARQQNVNQLTKELAKKKCDAITQQVFEKIILPQTHQQSDVAGALRLAVLAAEEYASKGVKPVVIIVSDLLQDIQSGNKPEPLSTFEFPAQTEILLIGADPSVNLETLFGLIKIRQLPSFQHLSI